MDKEEFKEVLKMTIVGLIMCAFFSFSIVTANSFRKESADLNRIQQQLDAIKREQDLMWNIIYKQKGVIGNERGRTPAPVRFN